VGASARHMQCSQDSRSNSNNHTYHGRSHLCSNYIVGYCFNCTHQLHCLLPRGNSIPRMEPNTDQITMSGKIKTTKRVDRSGLMKALQTVTKPLGPKISAPKGEYPAGSPQLDVHDCAKKECDVEERVVEDVYIYHLKLKVNDPTASSSEKERPTKQLFYFAGGSWQTPPSKEHWALCAEFAKQLPDTRVSIISCPLAPNSPAPVSMPQLLKCYTVMMQEAKTAGQRVVFAGDSSGGEILLCLTTNALAENKKAHTPVALIEICPSIDLRQENPEQQAIEKNDPILRVASSRKYADTWRGEWENTDPRINPLFADLASLARANVKVHGIVGGHDILRPDALILRDKLGEAGVEGEWLDWDKQMHGYPLTFSYGLNNGKEAKDWILELIKKA